MGCVRHLEHNVQTYNHSLLKYFSSRYYLDHDALRLARGRQDLTSAQVLVISTPLDGWPRGSVTFDTALRGGHGIALRFHHCFDAHAATATIYSL